MNAQAPLVVINVFTPKPGQLDAFVEAQAGGLRRMAGHIPGLRGGRLYRAADGSRAILVSVFESEAQLSQWLGSPDFAAHRERITPLIEKSEAGRYELVYESGSI
jgi:heme-degrading monooxygenase HmoA